MVNQEPPPQKKNNLSVGDVTLYTVICLCYVSAVSLCTITLPVHIETVHLKQSKNSSQFKSNNKFS